MGKPTMCLSKRSDTNRPVQLQKQARSLTFWSYVDEDMYYPSSENKGADQLLGYREADLRLCFRICRLLVFSWGDSLLRCFRSKECTFRNCIPEVNKAKMFLRILRRKNTVFAMIVTVNIVSLTALWIYSFEMNSVSRVSPVEKNIIEPQHHA